MLRIESDLNGTNRDNCPGDLQKTEIESADFIDFFSSKITIILPVALIILKLQQ
jgi:hypothetical protein